MALTPAFARLMSPFMAAVPASSFQYSARLNTKATPTDTATKSNDPNAAKADPTPSFWTSDTNASGDSPSGGDSSKSSSMKGSDTSSTSKKDDTSSRTGSTTSGGDTKSGSDTKSGTDTKFGGDTSRTSGAASQSGESSAYSPRGYPTTQSGDSSFRAGSGDSSSQSGDTHIRTGSSDTQSRSGSRDTSSSGGEKSSHSDDASLTSRIGEGVGDTISGVTSRIGEAASRGMDTLKRTNSSSQSWKPFSDYDTDFTDFFRNPFGMFGGHTSHQQHSMRNFPKVDIVEEGESLKIYADLPGIEKQDIKVHMDGSNNLRISGKRECEVEEEDDDRHYRMYERSCGRFSRNIRMPENVDKQSIDASFHNGVLTIQLKKTAAEDQRGSHIEIK